MGRIYLPPTEPVDPDETEDVESSASPSSTGRIYVSPPEPVAEVADDAAPDADAGKEGDSAEKPETVTVTEPAEVKPGPPPPKKAATAQRGKTTS